MAHNVALLIEHMKIRGLILSDLFFLRMILCTLFSSECHGQGRDQK